MTNEAIPVFGSTVTVSTAVGTLGAAAVDSESKTAITQNYLKADLTLAVTFSVAPVAGATIDVYRRDLNVDGVGDNPVPTATYTYKYIGSFNVDAVTSLQYLSKNGVPLSVDCELYIKNSTAQTMSSGWVLKAKPWTYGPAT